MSGIAMELSGRQPTARRLVRIFALESKLEFLKAVRTPAYAIPTLVFPWAFYIFFGLAFGSRMAGPVSMSTYMIATYGAFGVIGAALFGFGAGVASERGQGWLLVKMASPMPPLAYFVAKTVMSLLFSTIIVTGLFLLGGLFGDVSLGILPAVKLGATLILGAVPFCAMGLAIGFLAGPTSAAPIVNLVYLPMAFCSGLWIPVQLLPEVIRAIAPWLPPYHLAQLALGTIGASTGSSPWVHVLALGAFTALFLLIARFAWIRDEGKTWG